jgi:hypothetical protein
MSSFYERLSLPGLPRQAKGAAVKAVVLDLVPPFIRRPERSEPGSLGLPAETEGSDEGKSAVLAPSGCATIGRLDRLRLRSFSVNLEQVIQRPYEGPSEASHGRGGGLWVLLPRMKRYEGSLLAIPHERNVLYVFCPWGFDCEQFSFL